MLAIIKMTIVADSPNGRPRFGMSKKMKASLKIDKALPVSVLLLLSLLLGGCVRMSQTLSLASYDRDISSSTRDIETARDDAHRAAAYTKRGSAYSEKARYSRAFKLIPLDEYNRLFGLAIKDHDQAIALDPSGAERYYSRAQTYYDRAVLEVVVNGTLVGTDAERKRWFAPAVADFKKAIERDARYYMAWDGLGLIHETTGELDQAVNEYSQESALNPLGRLRLADAYCERGGVRQQETKDAAIADYEKSIDTGASADGCSCDPYGPLIGLYAQGRQYDQAWGVVHKARNAKKWIAPELLDKLKKESGRSN
jgi:tetratricopeptide (TPR) repeat protein